MSQKWAYMIVTPDGNPVTLDHRLQIYWWRGIAEGDAEKIWGGARVVRIPMPAADDAR